MSDCYLYRSEMDLAADGGEPGRAARAHAAACRACGEELRSRESLRALVRGLGRVEAPADFEFRLRARMSGGETADAGRRGPFRGLRLVHAFAPVAAAACFLVVSATLYYRQAARPAAVKPTAVAVQPPRGVAADAVAPSPKVEVAQRSDGGGGVPSFVDENNAVSAHAPESSKRAVGRTRQAASVASRGERILKPARETRLYGVDAARVLRPQGVTIALKTQSEPMRMILRDERGEGRVVPMRSVSFGSQEPIARQGTLQLKTVVEDIEGVW